MSVLCSKAVIQQACNEGHWNMSPRMSFASIFPASFCWIRLRCPSLNWELRGFLMGSLSSSKQQTFSKLLLILASVCAVSSTTVAFCLLNPVASLSHWSFVVVKVSIIFHSEQAKYGPQSGLLCFQYDGTTTPLFTRGLWLFLGYNCRTEKEKAWRRSCNPQSWRYLPSSHLQEKFADPWFRRLTDSTLLLPLLIINNGFGQ